MPNSSNSYVRRGIQGLAGYTPGEQLPGRRVIKLNTNECPYPPSPEVGRAAAAFDWTALNRYPDPSSGPVREAAARLFGFHPDEIICGNGSDDLLTIALRTFVDAGDGFAYPEPSYSLYPVLADLQGACKLPFELDDGFGLRVEEVLKRTDGAKLLILPNPNAPTGNAFSREDLLQLCRRFKGVVWIDEAYADFADFNCLDFVRQFPNVVVSRTFSKSYALAGLRLGMAFANASLVFEMNKLKDSYNVDRFAQCIGCAALADQRYLHETVARIRASREAATAFFQSRRCQVLPSQANFILVRPAWRSAREIFAALRDRGILVRHFDLPRVSDYLRITIGTPEQMQELFDAFDRLDCPGGEKP